VVDLKKWADYFNKNLGLDSASLDTIPAGRYTVLVQFSIGVEGRLSDISILKDPGYGLSQRIIKVISSCRGLWKLSMSHGRVIKNYRRKQSHL
jgi:hypothetical protein